MAKTKKEPIIFAVDDDAQVIKALQRDLRNEYRKEFRILTTHSAVEALDAIKTLKNKGETIAVLISDQRMPEMMGVDFLKEAKKIFPDAKKVLLTAYSDIDAAIRAINDVQLDYYLTKPWDPPEEKLFPILKELIDDWLVKYKPDFLGTKLIGYQFSPQSHHIKDFLSGNLMPYQWLDIEASPKAKEILSMNKLDNKDLPVVFFEDGSFLKNPSISEIGEKMGLNTKASDALYDVAIVGAGPAGLAAAVYGGSEGLKTLLIERRAPGGQAGTSSRIENYLGFPNGVSGAELTKRAIAQAVKFGIDLLSPQDVVTFQVQDGYKILQLADGSEVKAKSVVITTGVNYRVLGADGIGKFTGAGVYYGAANTEAQACNDKDVYIVGGGNSAGQAAMYLSSFARNVNIIVRKADLSSSMSHYLVDQINKTDNIHILGNTTVCEVSGSEKLECIVLEDLENQKRRSVEANMLLIFIGAQPCAEWIPDSILKNDKGFIETGKDLKKHEDFGKFWKLDREPFLLETCTPGVFAAGDVRAGAMNRVASAVGEGAMAIKFVHEYLAEI